MTVLLPEAVCLAGGLAAFLIKDRRTLLYVSTLTVLLAFAASLLAVFAGGETVTLLDMGAGLTLRFGVDGLGRFFLLLVSAVWCLVQVYAPGYMEHEGGENRFYGFYILTLGALLALSTAGNAVTAYMSFELMSLLSTPLVLHFRTEESRSAAIKYLGYSTLGASLALMGMFLLTTCAQSLEFTPGGVSFLPGSEGRVLAAALLIIAGFGSKAGLVPLQMWLPEAHPIAPTPASAVLSGIITKGGVLVIIRMLFYVFGADTLRGTWVQECLMILSLVTVFMGSMLALREKMLKKRLAYSSISNLSYALFGLLTLSEAGFVGAMLQVLFHALAKNALFLCAGSIISAAGNKRVDQLRGVGRRMPVTMWCFAIASLSLIGIPPTGGFAAKWQLCLGALETGSALALAGVIVLMASALLTAFYLLPIVAQAFFPGRDFDAGRSCEVRHGMLAPVIVFSGLTLALGILPGGLLPWLARLAGTLL
ncbi:MAG: proton-conducting membrane transporter [Butyricicoccus sp.]|nr:proton-conducting membrane transporter [Butyricicoccus sp.]